MDFYFGLWYKYTGRVIIGKKCCFSYSSVALSGASDIRLVIKITAGDII